MHNIIQGDCLEVMRTFPDNYFSAIVTDPPYGLSFMGKGWDHAVPRTEYWTECLRISKPGSFLIAMGGTRTFHRLASALEDSGYEIRDCLSWLYGSGFPKSHNHFGIKGYGSALKPAWEPILLCMKPLDGTFAQNAEKWGQAGINIDRCRIGTEERINPPAHNVDPKLWRMNQGGESKPCKGRWPANVMFDEEAARMLDGQSGLLKSGSLQAVKTPKQNAVYGKYQQANINEFQPNSGYASRFFYCAKTSSKERNEGLEGFPKIDSGYKYGYEPSEGRNVSRGETPKENNHPTVKPLALMRYLITLIAPPENALIFDPFAGSGSTVLAAKQLGIDCIGIEKQGEYCEIARARIDAYVPEPEQLDLLNPI